MPGYCAGLISPSVKTPHACVPIHRYSTYSTYSCTDICLSNPGRPSLGSAQQARPDARATLHFGHPGSGVCRKPTPRCGNMSVQNMNAALNTFFMHAKWSVFLVSRRVPYLIEHVSFCFFFFVISLVHVSFSRLQFLHTGNMLTSLSPLQSFLLHHIRSPAPPSSMSLWTTRSGWRRA